MTTPSNPPQLAPPGAGLPRLERFIANLMIRWQAARTSRTEAGATFSREQEAILALLQDRSPAELSRRVLIKRLPGLEDSSRHWSLLMVLDHLRIVNRDIGEVIGCLAAGRLPDREASIAGVKPSPDVAQAVIGEFGQGCRDFTESVARLGELRTRLKFAHPWFGPMDAAAWHFMTGFHMRLHRRQMELILRGLETGSND